MKKYLSSKVEGKAAPPGWEPLRTVTKQQQLKAETFKVTKEGT